MSCKQQGRDLKLVLYLHTWVEKATSYMQQGRDLKLVVSIYMHRSVARLSRRDNEGVEESHLRWLPHILQQKKDPTLPPRR